MPLNCSKRPITGVSTYNVTPQAAGVYFNKIQCFCFEVTQIRRYYNLLNQSLPSCTPTALHFRTLSYRQRFQNLPLLQLICRSDTHNVEPSLHPWRSLLRDPFPEVLIHVSTYLAAHLAILNLRSLNVVLRNRNSGPVRRSTCLFFSTLTRSLPPTRA